MFVGCRRNENISNPGEPDPGSLGLAINRTSLATIVDEYKLPDTYWDTSTARLSIQSPPKSSYRAAVYMYIVSCYYARSAQSALALQYSDRYKRLLLSL